jgi:hypothetical protein
MDGGTLRPLHDYTRRALVGKVKSESQNLPKKKEEKAHLAALSVKCC